MTLPPNDSRHEAHQHGDPNRFDELDRLLDLDRAVDVPRGLATRVLAGLHQREERALDVLVDLAGQVDDPPRGLVERVLGAVREGSRAAASPAASPAASRAASPAVRLAPGPRPRPAVWLPGGTLPRVAAAAAVLALSVGAWRLTRPELGAQGGTAGGPRLETAAAPLGVLEFLPVLERWDLLVGDGQNTAVDTADLDTLAALDDDDELLLLLSSEENG
ncbi:MAG: hypothetical protein R3F49_05070 [Planctomycetota bacterium]